MFSPRIVVCSVGLHLTEEESVLKSKPRGTRSLIWWFETVLYFFYIKAKIGLRRRWMKEQKLYNQRRKCFLNSLMKKMSYQ